MLLYTQEDIARVHVSFELWDGPPPRLDAEWPFSEVVHLHLPTGVVGVAPEGPANVFDVGRPGSVGMRLSWRSEGQKTWSDDPEAYALVQLWDDASVA